jgi:hypothetical protein
LVEKVPRALDPTKLDIVRLCVQGASERVRTDQLGLVKKRIFPPSQPQRMIYNSLTTAFGLPMRAGKYNHRLFLHRTKRTIRRWWARTYWKLFKDIMMWDTFQEDLATLTTRDNSFLQERFRATGVDVSDSDPEEGSNDLGTNHPARPFSRRRSAGTGRMGRLRSKIPRPISVHC